MSAQPELAPIGSATSRRLSLRSNFSWTFAGNIASTLSQFGMLLALARLGSTEMVGQYGLGLALTAPVFLLANMSLRNVQVTDVKDEYSFADYATLRVISSVLGILVIVAIALLLGYTRETAMVVVLLGISKAIEGMSDIIFGVFQKHEQMDKIAKSMILRAISTLIVFALLLWITENLIVGVVAISVVWLVRLATYDIPNLARLKELPANGRDILGKIREALANVPTQRRTLLALALLSLPVGLSTALVSFNTNIPRYTIEWSEGTAQLGVFTVLAYPLVAGNTVISALAQSSLPRLARHFSRNERREFIRLLVRLILLAVGLALVALLLAAMIGREALRIAFGEQYAEEEGVFLLLVLGMGAGFINWFFNSSLQAMRAFRTMLAIQIGVTALTMALALALVPSHGLAGAGAVVVVSLSVQVLVKTFVVSCRLQILRTGSLLNLLRINRS